MNMQNLLLKQSNLDATIIENMKLQELRHDFLMNNRVLAFIVELGEFANEVRSFKHWSTKLPSAKEVRLEEYVDCLHFLLSITNNIPRSEVSILNRTVNAYQTDDRLDQLTWANGLPPEQLINTTLIALTAMITEMYYNLSEDIEIVNNILVDIWDMFIFLGRISGFTLDEIEDAYYKKNKVNYKRQESGY